VLRPGNSRSGTAADHIETARLALAQLPRSPRRRVLVRADSDGGTREFPGWLTGRSRRLHYSIGMTVTEDMQAAIMKVPAFAWTPTCDGDGHVRDGAWVADTTELLAVHRHQRAPVHHLRHRRGQRPVRGPGTVPPPSAQVRRPRPKRQRHPAAHQAAEELRAELWSQDSAMTDHHFQRQLSHPNAYEPV
jgi:hypothetical protein